MDILDLVVMLQVKVISLITKYEYLTTRIIYLSFVFE